MNFKIKLPPTPKRNVYELTINVRYGEDGCSQNVSVGPFRENDEEDLLQDLIETLDRIKEFQNWPDNYSVAKGFHLWFDSLNIEEEEWEEMDARREKFMMQSWPCEPDCGTAGIFNSYSVIYYDSYGTACPVEIEYEK